MKLLGNFDQDTGNKYIDFLKENGIELEAVDVPHDYLSLRGMQRIRIDVNLFVPEEDYDKAVSLLKDFQVQDNQKIELLTKEANKVMLKILMGIIFCIAVAIYFKYFRG